MLSPLVPWDIMPTNAGEALSAPIKPANASPNRPQKSLETAGEPL